MKKIIWAVDAFQEMDKIQKNALQAIRALARQNDQPLSIEPVYVIPPDYANTSEFFYPSLTDFQAQAFQSMERRFRKTNLPGLLPPRILENPSFTTSGTASVLIEYATASHADLIVTGTHARHGMSRLFLGSFAESLILHSSVPVLSVSATTRTVRRFSQILFPSDFGEESTVVFPRILTLAKSLRARLTLLHVIFRPKLVRPGIQMLPMQKQYIRQQKEQSQKQFELFLKQAFSAGVSARSEDVVSFESASEVIAKFARKQGMDLVAMAARSGRFSSTLAGSATRQVVRTSSTPVWVLREMHTEALANRAA